MVIHTKFLGLNLDFPDHFHHTYIRYRFIEMEGKIPGQIPMFYGNTDNSGFSGTRMNPDKEKQLRHKMYS